MVDFEKLTTVLDRDDGKPVAYGVQFRAAKPFTTLTYVRADDKSVHMYVTVDSDYLPVAMALVHPPTPCVQYVQMKREDPEFQNLVLELYVALCEMAQLERAQRSEQKQERKKRALEKATKVAQSLEAIELAKAA